MYHKQEQPDLSISPSPSHGHLVRSAYIDKYLAFVLICGLDNPAASRTAMQGCFIDLDDAQCVNTYPA